MNLFILKLLKFYKNNSQSKYIIKFYIYYFYEYKRIIIFNKEK